jgi:hypothetical protein
MLDEEFFAVFDVGVFCSAAAGAAARTQEIQTNFDAADDGGGFLHGGPDAALELSAGVFDCFECTGQDAIGCYELAAETVGGFADDAIEFLCLAAREVDDVSGVGNHFGDFGLGVVEQDLNAGQNRADARLQVGGQTLDALGGLAHLNKHHGEHGGLENDGHRYDHDRYDDPGFHSCLTHAERDAPKKRKTRDDDEHLDQADDRWRGKPAATKSKERVLPRPI